MNVFRMTAMSAAFLAMAGCAMQPADAPRNTLVADKVQAAPTGAGDSAWRAARPLKVELSGGENFGGKGSTTATLKALYTGDTLYMLVQYDDPTDSVRRGPFQKQADGSWKQLVDPKNKGGDDNVYYEDKWAMLWPIANSVKGFQESGCTVACHAGEPGKPYGNKYTSSPGEMLDMWHMKGSRTAPNGYVDDQYCDSTRFDAKSPNAGRKSDPGGPEYTSLKLGGDGKPQFMNADAKSANAGGRYYMVDGTQVKFDDSRFRAGDEVASFLIHRLKGDRADITVTQGWNKGVHTSFVTRKLVTGSKFDVQFSDLSAQYPFGFAAFDNAQVRHAVHYDALFLRFAR